MVVDQIPVMQQRRRTQAEILATDHQRINISMMHRRRGNPRYGT